MIKLYNTLTREKELFKPINSDEVTLYACGPTVYWYAHIGNMRSYLFEDTLRRVLEYNGYKVKHVMNITDVGHLTSDADTGEDKMEKGALREKKSVWEIADYYTKAFKEEIKKLNIKEPTVWTKATDYIDEQIKLIKLLEEKGFTYLIEDGLYFDTSKLESYGRLWGTKKMELKEGARIGITKGKKNPSDFALWKLSKEKRAMEWPSPWGVGFPGWHTECVVMAQANLGLPFDIHCGGVDHIQIHHTNEIAQSEASYNTIPANFWLHGEFLDLKGEKMSKSEGNLIRVKTLEERGFDPLAFRYLALTAHYRTKLEFSWEALLAAQKSLTNLRRLVALLDEGEEETDMKEFTEAINNDLDTARALAYIQDKIRDKKLTDQEKRYIIREADSVFALDLNRLKKIEFDSYSFLSKDADFPEREKLERLLKERYNYREAKKWEEADKKREEIERLGFLIEDREGKPLVIKDEL